MVAVAQLFLWPWVYTTLNSSAIVLALAVLVAGLHRRLPAHLVTSHDGRWRLTPATVSLLLGVMVWWHYLFDVNPSIAAMCATSLVLAWVLEHPRLAPALPTSVQLAVWAAFFMAWLVAAGDFADRLTIIAWAVLLLGTHRYLVSRTLRRDLAVLRVLMVAPINLLPAYLPLLLPLHGGTRLGDGMAYAFCEIPDRGSLYATVPRCDTPRIRYEDCGNGAVVEYDLKTMTLVAAHRFFSPDFYGRFEPVVCLPDEVHAGIQGTRIRGRILDHSAMAFSAADPREFNPSLVEGLGVQIAYDEKHDAVFYAGEFTHGVVRYDRRTRRFDDSASASFFHLWHRPQTLERQTGSLVLHTTSIHPGRNRLYLAEWMQGRYAYALDLTTLQVVARYDVGGGGALGISVDPERDRLFVSSMWGIEVFDLATDGLIARKRLGLGNRPVIVDSRRNRLYVSSTIEGKIRVLDRDTFKTLAQIATGMGPRYAYLSKDGQYFFGSSVAAHYYWNADALMR